MDVLKKRIKWWQISSNFISSENIEIHDMCIYIYNIALHALWIIPGVRELRLIVLDIDSYAV